MSSLRRALNTSVPEAPLDEEERARRREAVLARQARVLAPVDEGNYREELADYTEQMKRLADPRLAEKAATGNDPLLDDDPQDDIAQEGDPSRVVLVTAREGRAPAPAPDEPASRVEELDKVMLMASKRRYSATCKRNKVRVTVDGNGTMLDISIAEGMLRSHRLESIEESLMSAITEARVKASTAWVASINDQDAIR
ncbi:YbaB/EbfC family nucleoid-associated protein [Actinomadura roseirufa]|uniref:YbaB/EbfC family nucleoid-associated protein n=1 Tax=Actinomadura roseirufa TaxID=2094049 RepID=UPI0013F14C46|nr:YbaB/EbfC family nucleoid-associated protein [Actinomadura roseirufa]